MKYLIKILFFGALIIGALALSGARYNECRRVHPWWYCIGGK